MVTEFVNELGVVWVPIDVHGAELIGAKAWKVTTPNSSATHLLTRDQEVLIDIQDHDDFSEVAGTFIKDCLASVIRCLERAESLLSRQASGTGVKRAECHSCISALGESLNVMRSVESTYYHEAT